MRTFLLAPLVCAALFAQTTPPKAPAKSASAAPAAGSRLLHPELYKSKAPDLYRVKFTTSKGDFVVEVHRDWSPLGADRFYNLVRSGYFAGNALYRMVPGVYVQFGINSNPAATKAWSAAPIKDDPVLQHNQPGTMVFAKGGPNSRTTQVFINLQDNSSVLDSLGFEPIGTVTEGYDTTVKGFYGGYGDMKEQGGSGPSQAQYTEQGKPYLDKSFPLLDKIVSATVIFPEAPVAPAKKASGTPTKK